MSAKKIRDLPIHVISELCRYLNVEQNGVQNWRDLLAHAPGNHYDGIYDVHAFDRVGRRPGSSPAEEVITDFIALGFSVDELYRMLFKMNVVNCMTLLTEYVSPAVVEELNELTQQPIRTSTNERTSPPPSLDIHPEYGPLPSHPPQSVTCQSHDNSVSFHSSDSSNKSSSSVATNRPIERPSYHPHPHPSYNIVRPCHVTSSSPSSVTTSPGRFSYDEFSDLSSQTLPMTTPTFSDVSVGSRNQVFSSSVSSSPPQSEAQCYPNILHFSYSDLSNATEGFTEEIIGMGTFGTVFKAKLNNNGPYAIKKLHNESEMGGSMYYDTIHRETFFQELQLLTRYNHPNILSLVAHSNNGPVPCLVYQYMENGSLAQCLASPVVLPWKQRLSIVKQIADALHFLHTFNCQTCLVHGDVKSANVLLDTHFVPKLSDFGLAKEVKRRSNGQSSYSTKSNIVMGTIAYMAPEFLRNKKLTPQCDVYSFGVVLLEVYTGQPALSSDKYDQNRKLTDRLAVLIDDSENHKDEVIQEADVSAEWPHRYALELFDIATVCLVHRKKDRPGMDQVLAQLQMVVPS